MEPLWTIEETAAFLKLPVETLRTWRKNKTGPRAARMGKHLRYSPQHVVRWFKECGGEVA
ncbi:helix-turn-helix domain-containing protein [Glycomyces artemisiae]|uniref:Helix-turn-helix protein n=1 Tax=Glycomyces artemisiae TaxID=1076443 RepID=A0A2T0UAC7_9ACTN|nr:helix-turn-helix domain-containing protein [Glycomyces artemisiae]PRY54895.1 helix-turn-helix protein [Glycomyces artemisiae]